MRVAVYTICKNEVHNVADWYQSASDADMICVADTGSTDGTLGLFKEKGQLIKLSQISINPWRFDDAHNAALSLVPDSFDICIPLHLDERLMPGWRDALEFKWVREVHTKAFYTYQFAPTLTFMQNRIHARKNYRWKYPAHEGIYPYGDIKEAHVIIPELRIEQKQDRSKDRSNTLKLLEMGVREYPNDSRMVHYYGRELMYCGRYQEALVHLESYVAMRGGEVHPVERAANADCIAQCYRALNKAV